MWQAEAIRRAFQARSTAGGRTGLDECEEQRRGLGLDWMPSSNGGVYSADKGPFSQRYGFSSSHEWM